MPILLPPLPPWLIAFFLLDASPMLLFAAERPLFTLMPITLSAIAAFDAISMMPLIFPPPFFHDTIIAIDCY